MQSQPSPAFAAEEVFYQAVALHEQGRLEEAEQLYRAILRGDEDHLGALHNLGMLCFQRSDYDGAVAFTREVVQQRPDMATAYCTLGIALRRLGRLAEAEACCREALRLTPTYAEAHNTLGDTLAALGRFTEAEACCREALRLTPTYAEAHNNLGAVLLSLGRPHEAEICCREAMRLKPGNPTALHNLFISLHLQQGIGEVAALLGRSMTLKSDFLPALIFLLAYFVSGNIRLAAGIVIAAGLAQLGGTKFSGRRIEPMRWMRFALVLVLGGATILTQDPRFVMVQSSVVHFAVAALMLRRDGMVRSIAPIALQKVPESVTVAAGYAWAALIAALGLINLTIALYFDLATWAWFISVAAIGAKPLRYALFRTIVRRRLAQFQRSTLGNPNNGEIDELSLKPYPSASGSPKCCSGEGGSLIEHIRNTPP
ncbi:MAG: tetratricopeptide repeat protein [Stellaceae bacterium]